MRASLDRRQDSRREVKYSNPRAWTVEGLADLGVEIAGAVYDRFCLKPEAVAGDRLTVASVPAARAKEAGFTVSDREASRVADRVDRERKSAQDSRCTRGE